MKLPKTMGCGRTLIKVKQPKVYGRGTNRGMAFVDQRVIHVAHYTVRNKQLSRRAPNERSETLWHELLHTLLSDMGHKQWADERFVTELAKRLNSAVIHAKF